MEITKSLSVGTFVANDYRAASVFQKYGIDFCCKGGKTIDEVCENKKIDPAKLLSELADLSKQQNNEVSDFKSWPLDLLADYIEKKHHRYIEQTTPSLKQFLDKLCKVHGVNHPELFEINKEFNASADELAAHMKKEELILFPYVRKMVSFINNKEQLEKPSFGTVQNPIQLMMQEHSVEGDRFLKIANLSNSYTVPTDGCNTYRVAFSLLKEFEMDLHLHIHLENNILFPEATALEKQFFIVKTEHAYETVSEAINDLINRGYTTDFEILAEKECLVCHKTSSRLSPEEFEIDEIYRFEGSTDPGDEMIVYAISSTKHNIKGMVVNAYGSYSDSNKSKIVERLKKHL
jgi:regulator of cell morphogenesis and NO signaling